MNLGSLSLSPSSASLLEKVAEGRSASLAELSSDLRLSPVEIRSDILELEEKGLAALAASDDDSVVVHVTPKGKEAYHLITKHPQILETPVAAMDEPDLDAAIELALERNRAGHSEYAAEIHPMDNLRDADATTT